MQNFLNRLIKIKNNLKNLLLVTDSKKQSLGSLDTGYIQLNNKLNNKGLSRERLSVISANSYKLVTKFIGNIINNQGKNSFTLWIDMNYRFAPSICNISNKKNMYLLREDDFKKTVKIYEILLKTQAIDLVVLEISQYLAAKYDISKYLKIMTIMLRNYGNVALILICDNIEIAKKILNIAHTWLHLQGNFSGKKIYICKNANKLSFFNGDFIFVESNFDNAAFASAHRTQGKP